MDFKRHHYPNFSANCAILTSLPILGTVLFDLFDRAVMG